MADRPPPRSRFRDNVLRIARANVIAQLILIAALPLLTRLYGPEAFGAAALFMFALQLLGTMCTARYDRVLPNARSERSASALVGVGSVALVVVTLACALLIAWHPPLLQRWEGSRVLGDGLWLLVPAVLATGLLHLYRAMAARSTELSPLSRQRLAQSVGYILIALLCALAGLRETGLVIAASVSIWFGMGQLMQAYPGRIPAALRTRRRLLVLAARRYGGQALLASLVAFVNTASLGAPVLLLGQLFGSLELGWYALMTRLVVTPLGTVTTALSVSFWARSAELARSARHAEMRRLYLRLTRLLLMPAAGVVVLASLAPLLIAPVFGEQWRGAGQTLLAAVPYLVGYTLFSATSHLIVVERQGLQLLADGLRIVLMLLVAGLAAHYQASFVMTVFGLSCASLAGHVALFALHLLVYRQLLTGRSAAAKRPPR